MSSFSIWKYLEFHQYLGKTHLCVGGCVWKVENPLPSSECVEAFQPPVTEESVRPVRRVLVASSGRCAEVGQHGPVVLSLCCSLSIFLIIIPEGKETTRPICHSCRLAFHLFQVKRFVGSLSVKRKSKWMWFSHINPANVSQFKLVSTGPFGSCTLATQIHAIIMFSA